MPVSSSSVPCPKCGSHVKRIHRTALDRLISVVRPRHRFRCSKCN